MDHPIIYLALGDSLTQGVGADQPDRHFVAQYFGKLKHSNECRLMNMGISGLTSGELLELIGTSAIRKLIPHATHITITTGGCDFIDWYEKGASMAVLTQSMKKVWDRTGKVMRQIRDLNPDASVQVLGFYLPLPAYEWGFKLASRVLKSMNFGYAHLSRKYGVQLVNPFDAFLYRKDFFADEVHPNQKGYNVLAELFQQSCVMEKKESIPRFSLKK
ncbi:GDSL-type esterase/lipase family protein [Melghirimyces algeriensis]|uniref:Lysophospholipase L1 n=1 Tax=Melghirimyces algeriensis TaxID=910412 RepID=A0A521CQL9_9BACL|nr:GDSL-type esterase/lipase family protein [Melghirimyces algeriensis]SMO61733.1 Lysophospholipase L1 [Melghirimyces algeriensis]